LGENSKHEIISFKVVDMKQNYNDLTLSEEEMRKLGYKAIDILIDHISTLKDKPVTRSKSRNELELIFRENIPEQGMDSDELLQLVQTHLLSNIMHIDHPRFLGFISSPSNFISILGDLFTSAFNFFAGTWIESSSAAQIELVVLDWMKKFFHFPTQAGGIFLSGGSMANLVALVVARTNKYDSDSNRIPKFYYSTQTHSSVDRALRILGFSEKHIEKIPVDTNFNIQLSQLEQQIQQDVRQNCVPVCIIANAGTTNTGTVDPIVKMVEIAKNYNVWLHVDGAYGLAAILDPNEKNKFTGLGKADSITFDPHKWWFQPYEISGLLVRDAHQLRDTFHILPEYLKDLDREFEEINFCDYGPQLTRNFRALKFWLSLKYFGINEFRKAVQKGISNAKFVEKMITEQFNKEFKIISPAKLAIICFRYYDENLSNEILNSINKEVVQEMIKQQWAMISSTTLHEIVCLRFCTINPRTTDMDLLTTLNRIINIGRELVKKYM